MSTEPDDRDAREGRLNMYDLPPCSKCGGLHCTPDGDGKSTCDDCGHREPLPSDHYAHPDNKEE